MRRFDLCLLPLSLLFLVVLCVGCGEDNPRGRKAISGRVRLNNEPLEQGNIEFHPMFEGGAQSGGKISSGSYSIPAHEGVMVGKYRVSISEFVPTPAVPAGHMPGDPLPPSPKPQVPADWNTKSQHMI